MPKLTESVRDQIAQREADARRDFASDVDGFLTELRRYFDALGEYVGAVSRDDAWRQAKAFVLERFEARLPLRPSGDPVLLQLVKEAYEHFESPESPVDVNEWVKTARPFVK